MIDPRRRFARTGHRLNGPFGLAIPIVTSGVTRKKCGSGGACRQIQLQQDVGDVPLHGVVTQPQAFGNCRIAQAIRDKLENLAFPSAQHFEAGCPRALAHMRHRLEVLLGDEGEQPQRAVQPVDRLAAALCKMKP
jgi:hypothetical protein